MCTCVSNHINISINIMCLKYLYENSFHSLLIRALSVTGKYAISILGTLLFISNCNYFYGSHVSKMSFTMVFYIRNQVLMNGRVRNGGRFQERGILVSVLLA